MKRGSDKNGSVRIASLIWVVAFVALVSLPTFAQSSKSENRSIEPNAQIQSYLRALISTNQQVMFDGTEESLSERLTQLRKMAGQDTNLAAQLMYFSDHAEGEREAMLPGVILEQLAIPNTVFAEVCLLLLDAEDEPSRRLGAEWLTRADHVTGGGVDFSQYENILRIEKGAAPQGLIRYMYQRNPQAAVVSVARVFEAPASEVVEAKAKSGGKESTTYFAGRSEWWAQLYVAEVMRKEPTLRNAKLIEQLKTSTNELVREAVKKIGTSK